MRFLLLAVLAVLTIDTAVAAVDYDIVYVRQARFGDNVNTIWPEVGRPGRIDPGADLILRRPDGSEEVLVSCTVCSVTDPMVSFDAQWVYYSLFHDVRPGALNSQRGNLPKLGADIFRIHLESRDIEQLTFGEFTPNTGTGNWDESNPLDPPSGYNRLGYGILNLGPMPLPGGRLAFTSNRNGFSPTRPFTNPVMQMFVMDVDGENIDAISPMTLNSALHPTILNDGRLMFSSYESQGLRDRRIWAIWAIRPDGQQWEPLVSAMTAPDAFHFMTQISNGDIIVEAYYNLNNNGFGALYGFPAEREPGEPAFHSPYRDLNPDIDYTTSGGDHRTFRMPFTPKGYYAVTPMTHGGDSASPLASDGTRVGKFTHPSTAPNNDLLVAWSPGPVNTLNRPTPLPYPDSGIYLVAESEPVWDRNQLIPLVEDSSFNAAWPRAVVPWSAIHGQDEPDNLGWLANDGSQHPELPEGTAYGLTGTSSMYKRETFPDAGSPKFDGLEPFNTSQNRNHRNHRWSNWIYQGADAGKYDNEDIWAVRVLAMEGIAERRYGPHADGRNGFYNHANERLRILGEIPVRNLNADGSPKIDAEGNPDTSFLVKLPADTPFTFQTLDRNGMVLNMAQTWHQVRPGEMRADCGGCHAHSQEPLAFEGTAANQADYLIRNLGESTPLLSQTDNGEPSLIDSPLSLVDVEFYRDIRPILQRSCVQCHNASDMAGNLNLADTELVSGCNWNDPTVPGDYRRLAADECAEFGYPPLISNGVWRNNNASRYVRKFQSRRSLLAWKVFGERLDGWSNDDHPSAAVPGDPSSLPEGASPNDSDIDYTGTIMPPPDSGVPALGIDEKMMIARWIDLGAPIDLAWQYDYPQNMGWFMDTQRPTLAISQPRPNLNATPPTQIDFAMADANSGLDQSTLSVTASFAVNGRPAGSELADLAVYRGDGRYRIALDQPVSPRLYNARIFVEVADNQGNIARSSRRFHTIASGDIFSDRFQGD